ncbi:MAG: ubiquinone/menaquinone biosynthesis methyltransferase, partial [Chthonomonadales bacterium]
MNDVLSFNRHRAWRKYAVSLANVGLGDTALDVCTGTGDFAIDLYNKTGPTGTVIGSDFCEPMVRLGKVKTDKVSSGTIGMSVGDAQAIPFAANSFDVVTVGFGIRNVVDTAKAFTEMTRVARPGGRVVCLEFTQPRHWFWSRMVNFYNKAILPIIGSMLSRGEAYRYLPASIDAFHSREELSA